MNRDRPGYDARRRNRNIGTENAGFKEDNRFKIPERWTDARMYYEVLSNPRTVVRTLHGREITYLVEPTHGGCVHGCTVDDIFTLLRLLPGPFTRDIEVYVLRQPTEKQRTANPVWGRLSYWSSLGRFSGPSVTLEAQPIGEPNKWDRSLGPADQEELDRLREDGHPITETKRHFILTPTLDSIRSTLLYRTLPHELGHLAHYEEEVESRIDEQNSRDDLEERYFQKPSAERESYAHRVADTVRRKLRELGSIPFDRIGDSSSIRKDGLEPSWFGID